MKAEIWFDHWGPSAGATIMDAVILQEARNVTQMKEINTSRTWMRVHYTTDVTAVGGKKIQLGYVKGNRVRESS